MNRIAFVIIALLCVDNSFSQVGIGTTTPDNSSILEVESTSQGILVPRLTTAQENAITTPATGLLIYNTDCKEFRFNRSTTPTPNWIKTSRNTSIKYSNNATDTSVNVNSNTAANAPIISTIEWNDDTTVYTANTALNNITVNEDGRYRITINISLATTSGTDRLTPEMWIEINGTQRGTYSSTGYIRTNNNHQESSLHITEVFELLTNDVISVSIGRTANNGTVNLRSNGSSNIYIEKI